MTAFAIFLAGSLLFVSQLLFQQILAVSFGTGSGLVGLVIAINLLGGAVGAKIPGIPRYLSPVLLGAVFLSPFPRWALETPNPWITGALSFGVALFCGNWVTILLSTSRASRASWLLGMEWLGGAIGVALFLVVLLPHFSLGSVGQILGIASLLGAVLSLTPPQGKRELMEGEGEGQIQSQLGFAMGLSAWSGFQFFFAETIWTHLFAQLHTNSYMAFGTVLLAMLVGMPLAAWASKRIHSLRIVSLIAGIGFCSLPISHHLFSGYLTAYYAQDSFPWTVLFFATLILSPVAASASLLFPFLLRQSQNTRTVRNLYLANLLGGLAGAFAAGFLALPHLGLALSLCLPTLGWVFLLVSQSPAPARKFIAPSCLLFLIATYSLWFWEPGQSRNNYQVLQQSESWEGRLQLVERDGSQFLLYNGRYSLGGTRALEAERKQARLAMDLRPDARSAFVLGLGTGVTAGELLASHNIQHIRVIELSPSVVDYSKRHFRPWIHGLFDSSQVRVESGDARVALQRDTSRYDIILGDLFLPWLPGAELLMGKEHFQSVLRHLSPHGLFVQWLPLYQLTEPMFQDILATTLQVFENVYLFRADLGSGEPMIALVAPAPGSSLYSPGVRPNTLEDYAGNARNLAPMLQDALPWDADNRIARVLHTGGMYPGMPSPQTVMAGERYLNWIAKAFRARPPESEPAIKDFGSDAWRYSARGFFSQQAIFYQEKGDPQGAELMRQRAVEYGPRE
jgi:spermidine synthase